MSDQTGADEGAGDPTGPFGVRAPWARKDPSKGDEARHSALVGSMSVRVHDRIPLRRSTLVMVVAFLGFGVLFYLYPAQSTTTGPGTVVHTQNGDYFIPGATRVAPSTTTTSSATTTTAGTQPIPPAPSTTTTTARAGSATSTASTPPSVSTSTTSVGASTTTTTVAGPTGTSTSTTGGQTTTTP